MDERLKSGEFQLSRSVSPPALIIPVLLGLFPVFNAHTNTDIPWIPFSDPAIRTGMS
jgi:hypothetical protein